MQSRLALLARAAVVALLAAAGVTLTASGATAASTERYVALGDSAASGPLVLPQTHLGCARSATTTPATSPAPSASPRSPT